MISAVIRVTSRGQNDFFTARDRAGKEALREKAKDAFQLFYSWQPLAVIEPRRLSRDQELKTRTEFSSWVDKFLSGDGFEALWDLQLRHGIHPDAPIMLLTWWKIRDMQFARIPHGNALKEKFRTQKDRGRLAQRLLAHSNKLMLSDKHLTKPVDLLTGLRLTIGFISLPSKQQFPFIPLPLTRDIVEIRDYLHSVAQWIRDLPPPAKGGHQDFENFSRVIHLCGYFKGYSEKPLYETAFRVLNAAFPSRFLRGGKVTALKRVQRALQERGDDRLPETVVPPKKKTAARKIWQRWIRRPRR